MPDPGFNDCPGHPKSAQSERMRAMNSAIELLGRYWSVEGDTMRCRACYSGQRASRANEVFSHASDCIEAHHALLRPWHSLAELLRDLPPVEP